MFSCLEHRGRGVKAHELESWMWGRQAVRGELFCYFVQQHGELTLRGMGKIDRGESRNKGQPYIREAIWSGLSDEGQFLLQYHRSEFSSVSVPSWGEVRMDPFLNDWAADQAPANHSHKTQKTRVIMRICDAGKRASADLSPTICGLAVLALVQIKSFLRGNFTIFLSIILHIKDMEQVIYREDTGILLSAIKMNTIICDKSIFLLCMKRHQRSVLNLSVLRCNAKRE